MKWISTVLSVLVIISCIVGSAGLPVRAIDNEDVVEGLVDEFCKDIKCSSVSVAVFDEGEVNCYGDVAGLYQIGSMTKAFTGLAIHKLMSEGKLAPDSTVSELINGFTAYYDSKPYEITVEQLLKQTSGYNNSESLYPSADMDMSLQDWALSISGKELQSVPGEKYAYSNVNFNLLGAIIEKVTGQSYKDYMENEILTPLGLTNTFVSINQNSKRIISGSRLGYRIIFPYEIPVAEGRIPAGYFYSNAEDMVRWMQIWLGTVDIPEEYRELVAEVKEHLTKEGDYYSGWEVFADGVIGHSGGTPNYSSRMVFEEKNNAGVCVLTNLNVAASTDSLCNSIFGEVTGGSKAGIATDVWTIFDIIFSVVSVTGVILAASAFRIKKRNMLLILGIAVTVLVIAICIVMPLVFGAGLGDIMFVWAPISFAGGLILLAADILIIGIRFWVLKERCGSRKDRLKASR